MLRKAHLTFISVAAAQCILEFPLACGITVGTPVRVRLCVELVCGKHRLSHVSKGVLAVARILRGWEAGVPVHILTSSEALITGKSGDPKRSKTDKRGDPATCAYLHAVAQNTDSGNSGL